MTSWGTPQVMALLAEAVAYQGLADDPHTAQEKTPSAPPWPDSNSQAHRGPPLNPGIPPPPYGRNEPAEDCWPFEVYIFNKY
jgi:hypothetical protein